jgi:hypothetical protein
MIRPERIEVLPETRLCVTCSIAGEPVVVLNVPRRVPAGFHGNFVAGQTAVPGAGRER